MAVLCRWLQLISWTCLLACSPAMGAVTDFETGVAEFDPIFPRNETYAPSLLFPFIFAFQNPAVVRSMNPAVSVNLMRWNESTSDWDVTDTESLDLENLANASDSEPFFAHHVFGGTFNTEAYWTYSWVIGWQNCTQEEGRAVESHGINTWDRVYFTTKEGAQEPELFPAAENPPCSESEGYTWNITEIVRASGEDEVSCAFFSSTTPTARPCEAQVGSETVESILASATDTFCGRLDELECPADKEDEQGGGGSIRGSLAAVWTACFASFVGGMGLFLA